LASSVPSGSTYIAEEIAHRLQRDAGFEFFGLTRDAFETLTDESTADEVKGIYRNLFIDRSGWACSKIHLASLAIITREARRDDALHEAFFGPKARWLIMRRRNKIAQAVSVVAAEKTGAWHVYDSSNTAADSVTNITPKDVEDALREIILDDVYLDAFSRNIPVQRLITNYLRGRSCRRTSSHR